MCRPPCQIITFIIIIVIHKFEKISINNNHNTRDSSYELQG